MDGTSAGIISALSATIATLFGALMLSMRQSREDWKALYDSLKKEVDAANDELRKSASTNARLVELSFRQNQQAENIRTEPKPLTRRTSDEQ